MLWRGIMLAVLLFIFIYISLSVLLKYSYIYAITHTLNMFNIINYKHISWHTSVDIQTGTHQLTLKHVVVFRSVWIAYISLFVISWSSLHVFDYTIGKTQTRKRKYIEKTAITKYSYSKKKRSRTNNCKTQRCSCNNQHTVNPRYNDSICSQNHCH